MELFDEFEESSKRKKKRRRTTTMRRRRIKVVKPETGIESGLTGELLICRSAENKPQLPPNNQEDQQKHTSR
jgi:hypothetical protein